jgi:hypothetical protein
MKSMNDEEKDDIRPENEGFSEPRSGIVGAPKELNLESRRDSLENPRSSIDVTKLRLVKSTEDDDEELCNCNLCYTFRYIALCIARCLKFSNKIE